MNNETPPAIPSRSPEELALLKQQEEHQYEIALKQIDANLKNNQETRAHVQTITKQNGRYNLIFCMSALILFFAFGFYALFLGKESFLADVLKVIVGALGGGGLGFYFGFRQRQQQQPPQQ